jgi:hypothetical protein
MTVATSVTTSNFYATSGWFRNDALDYGLYNSAAGTHFACRGAPTWALAFGGSTVGQLVFYRSAWADIRGYIYFDTSGFGLLNPAGGWCARIDTSNYWHLSAHQMQDYGYYIYPGSTSTGGTQSSYYLASHSTYGLFTNTGMYFSGSTYTAGHMKMAGGYVYPGSISGYPSWQDSVYLASHQSYGGLYTNGGFCVIGALYVNSSLVQQVGAYIYPGSASGLSAWQGSYYLASHASYGIYINTGLYAAGTVYCAGVLVGSRFQDINYSGATAVSFDASLRVVLTSGNAPGVAACWDGTNFTPNADTNANLGSPQLRWNTAWIYNGVVLGSDARDKRDVRPTVFVRAFLAALKPVDYTRDDLGEVRHSGFLAQQIAEVAPDFGGIHYGEDGVASGLNYTHFIAPLVAGWQDHETRLKALEQRGS